MRFLENRVLTLKACSLVGSLFLALSRTFRFVLCGHKTDRVSVCALVLFSALLFASLSLFS